MNWRAFLAKAQENLSVAERELEYACYNAVANRAYYAMFHAAIAALLAKGFWPPTGKFGHDWVQARFAERLIKRKKVYAAKFASYLLTAMDVRHTADYEEAMVNRKTAQKTLGLTRQFVNAVMVQLETGVGKQ